MTKTSKRVSQKNQFIDFGQAIRKFWHGYANFSGRSSRPEFWFGTLFCAMICTPLLILVGALIGIDVMDDIWVVDPVLYAVSYLDLWFLLFMPFLLPLFALTVRRFRDAGIPVSLCVIPTFILWLFGLVPMNSDMLAFVFVLFLVPFIVFNVVVGCLPSRK